MLVMENKAGNRGSFLCVVLNSSSAEAKLPLFPLCSLTLENHSQRMRGSGSGSGRGRARITGSRLHRSRFFLIDSITLMFFLRRGKAAALG